METGTDVITRPSIEDVFAIKCTCLRLMKTIEAAESECEDMIKKIDGYLPFRVEWSYGSRSLTSYKQVDAYCWRYVVALLHLERYMLCTEFKNMTKEIDEGKAPEFTPENVGAWLESLKSLIHENVRAMMKSVYEKIITGSYYTGGRNGDQKKRNNNGIDASFILYTGDHSRVHQYGYYWNHPTITDDLEKACYLIAGEELPEHPLKNRMAADKTDTGECPYFSIRVCKNGNTHYSMKESTRQILNRIGPDGNLIGEKIRIKIFDKEWKPWQSGK